MLSLNVMDSSNKRKLNKNVSIIAHYLCQSLFLGFDDVYAQIADVRHLLVSKPTNVTDRIAISKSTLANIENMMRMRSSTNPSAAATASMADDISISSIDNGSFLSLFQPS